MGPTSSYGTSASGAPVYFVYAWAYNENSGGIVFLHRLVHELRALGEEAYIYPNLKVTGSWWRRPARRLRTRFTPFLVAPDLNTPVWKSKHIPENAIVVYSETESGNPLQARNIARWLLFKPGLNGRATHFDPSGLFFKCSDFSDHVGITGGAQLLSLWYLNPHYRDRGGRLRNGTCYMKRKGANQLMVHDLTNSRCLDGLPHADIADAFNTCETFYSYDDATMYSLYAALCGCDSIVVPHHYPSREDWVRDRPVARYGVAYGLDDLDHARTTRHLVKHHLSTLEENSRDTVKDFVRTTKRHFGFFLDEQDQTGMGGLSTAPR